MTDARRRRTGARRTGSRTHKRWVEYEGRGMYAFTTDRLPPMKPNRRIKPSRFAVVKDFAVNDRFKLSFDDVGGNISAEVVTHAIIATNGWLALHSMLELPLSKSGKMLSSLDVHGKKAIGNFIGRSVSYHVQDITWNDRRGLRCNPVDRGHPDLIPAWCMKENDFDWSRVPHGIEIKTTCGRLSCRAGTLGFDESRIDHLASFTWASHHKDSKRILGTLWDYVMGAPQVVAVFYCDGLQKRDYTEQTDPTVSKGHSTNSSSIRRRGRDKFKWVCVADDSRYVSRIRHILPMCSI